MVTREESLNIARQEYAVAKLLTERHRLSWDRAKVIAVEIIALRVVDGSLTLPLDLTAQKLKPLGPKWRKKFGLHDAAAAAAALEDFRS